MNENNREFLSVLENRKAYLNCLLKLSLSQNRIIGENNYDELLIVLQKKQNIISRMEEFRQGDLDMKKEWDSIKPQLGPNTRKECETVIDDSREILEEIISSEKISTDFLMKRRDETHTQLKELQGGDRVHHAYRQNTHFAQSRILDVDQ